MVNVNKIVNFTPQNGANLINMLKLEKRAGITAYIADGGGSDACTGGKLRLCHAAVGEQFAQ